MVVDQFGDLQMRIVRYVVPSQSPTWPADAQIPLGAMSWSVGTMAVWSTAALVRFDQGAAQHLLHRRQFAYQLTAAFAQRRGGKSLQRHRTESPFVPKESEADSSVNSKNAERGNQFDKRNQTESVDEEWRTPADSLFRHRPIGPFPRHRE